VFDGVFTGNSLIYTHKLAYEHRRISRLCSETETRYQILGSHSGVEERSSLLEHKAMQIGKNL